MAAFSVSFLGGLYLRVLGSSIKTWWEFIAGASTPFHSTGSGHVWLVENCTLCLRLFPFRLSIFQQLLLKMGIVTRVFCVSCLVGAFLCACQYAHETRRSGLCAIEKPQWSALSAESAFLCSRSGSKTSVICRNVKKMKFLGCEEWSTILFHYFPCLKHPSNRCLPKWMTQTCQANYVLKTDSRVAEGHNDTVSRDKSPAQLVWHVVNNSYTLPTVVHDVLTRCARTTFAVREMAGDVGVCCVNSDRGPKPMNTQTRRAIFSLSFVQSFKCPTTFREILNSVHLTRILQPPTKRTRCFEYLVLSRATVIRKASLTPHSLTPSASDKPFPLSSLMSETKYPWNVNLLNIVKQRTVVCIIADDFAGAHVNSRVFGVLPIEEGPVRMAPTVALSVRVTFD